MENGRFLSQNLTEFSSSLIKIIVLNFLMSAITISTVNL